MIVAVSLILSGSAVWPTRTVEATPIEETISQAGPLGPITVIGDSVLLGSLAYSPTVGDQLAALGWGPVRMRAGEGYSTGYFNVSASFKVSSWVASWRQQGWDPPNLLINLGANDSGQCGPDVACARRSILHLVDAIGPGHRIWWPQITRFYTKGDEQNAWNTALTQIAAERSDFFTWDWPAVLAAGDFGSNDGTHLSAAGYRRRSRLLAVEATSDLAIAVHHDASTPLPAPTAAPSEFVPIAPTRVLDTREDAPGHVAARQAVVVDVSDYVPVGTTAIAAYMSATNTGADGFLTAYDCGSGRPEASTANYRAGDTRGAVAITPIAADGTFCLYTLADADLLVDLQGGFIPVAPDGLTFTPLSIPDRLVDTRETGRFRVLEIPLPAGAAAASVSVTAVFGAQPGFLTVYPCGDTIPLIATVNYGRGEMISGSAFIRPGPSGTICVYSLTDVDVTVDLTGVFTTGAGLLFVPITPTRTVDTRYGIGGWSPIHGQYQTIDARVAPDNAVAVSGTLTTAAPLRDGWLRAWGCGPAPETANVTAVAGAVLANSVTTGLAANGRVCILSRSATQTIFDTSGWWVTA